jgi:hypothetical protein
MRRDLRESINARARELMRGGLLWMDAHRQADNEHRCGARCRTGLPCVRRPEPGKARCANHGGKSTGARTEEGRERLRQNAKVRPRVDNRWVKVSATGTST